MKKPKKEVYKRLLNNLLKTNSISQSTRNILSEKGGRLICKRLESNGYILADYPSPHRKFVYLTDKGKELLNKLNDFSFEFKEKELFE